MQKQTYFYIFLILKVKQVQKDSFKPCKHHCVLGQINVLRQRRKLSTCLSFLSYYTVRYGFFTELTMFCTVLALFCIGVS